MKRSKRLWILGTALIILVAVGFWANSRRPPRHFHALDAIEKTVSAAIARATGGLYRLKFSGIAFDPAMSSLTVRGVELSPDPYVVARRRVEGELPRAETKVIAAAAHIFGVDVGELLLGRVTADSVAIDSLVIEVFVNKKVESKGPDVPKQLPHDHFQAIPGPVKIGAIRVDGGAIRYSELALDSARPGMIRFEDLHATLSNVTNDPALMTGSTPCRIHAHTKMSDAGQLDVTFAYNLLAPRLNLTYEGTFGSMPAKAVNEILVDLKGLRVGGGTHDSTRFRFEVIDDVATGEVQVLYHDLEIEMLDKITREQGLGDKLATFFANTFKIRGTNQPEKDEPAKSVSVHRTRSPNTNFFRFIWENLREGVLETLNS